MSQDPIVKFSQWLELAKKHYSITEPTAMCLATADAQGQPSARIVLLKAVDGRGFVFYGNKESHKGTDLSQNPKAALCFHWMPLEKQVRVEGRVEPVSDAEADAYFATRPRESRIGAWSSRQSRPLASRDALMQAIEENTSRFKDQDIPRPNFWSGWRVIPASIEFWQQSEFRLHDRELFTRNGDSWETKKLYP